MPCRGRHTLAVQQVVLSVAALTHVNASQNLAADWSTCSVEAQVIVGTTTVWMEHPMNRTVGQSTRLPFARSRPSACSSSRCRIRFPLLQW